jgi:hypothetical protein
MATMRSFSARTLSLLAFALTLGAGCSFGVGSDYAVTVTWLINGTAPSSALCESQGVDRIRFTVLSPGNERSLYADCDSRVTLAVDGLDYGGFVSTSSFSYGVSYRYRVDMVDANGRTVQVEANGTLEDASYTDTFTVDYGDEEPWVLTPLELFSPSGDLAGISGEWTIDGQKATADGCQKLGAVSVAIDFASSTDLYFDDAVEIANTDCAAGIVFSDGAVLDEGEYNVRYVALNESNEVVGEVIADQLYVVDAPGTLDIETIDFDL